MIKALAHFVPEWFTPPDQEPGDETRFKVRGLNGSQQAQMIPACSSDKSDGIIITADALYILLRDGLVAWENFSDGAGAVKWSPNPEHNQNRIPYATQSALASKIFELTFLDAETKKK